MKALEVIIERSHEGELFGRIEDGITGIVVGSGYTMEELNIDLREALELHYEVSEEDNLESSIENISFNYKYDIQQFFEQYSFINVSKLAEVADMNPSLLRQYSKGITHPSEKQLKKIETAIHQIGKELSQIAF